MENEDLTAKLKEYVSYLNQYEKMHREHAKGNCIDGKAL